jgi:hypothetical protein
MAVLTTGRGEDGRRIATSTSQWLRSLDLDEPLPWLTLGQVTVVVRLVAA